MRITTTLASTKTRTIYTGLYIILFLFAEVTASISWLAINKTPLSTISLEQTKSLRTVGLTKSQAKLFRRDDTIAPVVQGAASTVIMACETVFNQSRWNCSSLRDLPQLSPELKIGTKEQAYVYALASSQLSVNVATACSKGDISQCSCNSHEKVTYNNGGTETIQEDFLRRGCSINLKFGLRFSEKFTEAPYKKVKKLLIKGKEIPDTRESREALMNIHNGKIGRQAVRNSMTMRCKCHGMSGSCEVKTCWTDLNNTKLLNDLAMMYEAAQALPESASITDAVTTPQSSQSQHDKREADRSRDTTRGGLMFYKMSSDYCNKDPRKGSRGTKGRKCGDEYSDTCSTMCCGRGHIQVIHTVTNDRCHCKHIWCCYVECEVCKVDVTEYYCN